MKKIFILVLLSISISANTLVDMYRDSGLSAVEAYIKEQLQSKKITGIIN